jgi:hypothetical protein
MTNPRPKSPPDRDSWNEEQDKMTNPNRRQDEEQDKNVDPQRGGQRTRDKDYGSTESKPSDRRDEHQKKDPSQKDPTRKQYDQSTE